MRAGRRLHRPWFWLLAGSCAISIAALLAMAARQSADAFRGKAADVRRIGAALDVRYVLEGSVRRIDDTLRINVQLVSAETGMHLWSDRFDEQAVDLGLGQERAMMRMRDELAIALVDIESARSLRERPNNPDAFDLILRARSMRNLPESPQRNQQVRTALEHGLALDPTSTYAMTYLAYTLTDAASEHGWGSLGDMQRAEGLLNEARARAPDADFVLNAYVFWLRTVGRCPEAIELAQRASDRAQAHAGLDRNLQ